MLCGKRSLGSPCCNIAVGKHFPLTLPGSPVQKLPKRHSSAGELTEFCRSFWPKLMAEIEQSADWHGQSSRRSLKMREKRQQFSFPRAIPKGLESIQPRFQTRVANE